MLQSHSPLPLPPPVPTPLMASNHAPPQTNARTQRTTVTTRKHLLRLVQMLQVGMIEVIPRSISCVSLTRPNSSFFHICAVGAHVLIGGQGAAARVCGALIAANANDVMLRYRGDNTINGGTIAMTVATNIRGPQPLVPAAGLTFGQGAAPRVITAADLRAGIGAANLAGVTQVTIRITGTTQTRVLHLDNVVTTLQVDNQCHRARVQNARITCGAFNVPFRLEYRIGAGAWTLWPNGNRANGAAIVQDYQDIGQAANYHFRMTSTHATIAAVANQGPIHVGFPLNGHWRSLAFIQAEIHANQNNRAGLNAIAQAIRTCSGVGCVNIGVSECYDYNYDCHQYTTKSVCNSAVQHPDGDRNRPRTVNCVWQGSQCRDKVARAAPVRRLYISQPGAALDGRFPGLFMPKPLVDRVPPGNGGNPTGGYWGFLPNFNWNTVSYYAGNNQGNHGPNNSLDHCADKPADGDLYVWRAFEAAHTACGARQFRGTYYDDRPFCDCCGAYMRHRNILRADGSVSPAFRWATFITGDQGAGRVGYHGGNNVAQAGANVGGAHNVNPWGGRP
eukprot:TRINITY_DN3972_c0_g2_i2.p1 TRINITY_DN3972_c0_g2~~TRINITY_DN3972_c0_g2_i2.p1  ORF type:complete len:561 (+),score=44.66 TRINITY_DN3972_c0_g2_i2:295-1977(+)